MLFNIARRITFTVCTLFFSVAHFERPTKFRPSYRFTAVLCLPKSNLVLELDATRIKNPLLGVSGIKLSQRMERLAFSSSVLYNTYMSRDSYKPLPAMVPPFLRKREES